MRKNKLQKKKSRKGMCCAAALTAALLLGACGSAGAGTGQAGAAGAQGAEVTSGGQGTETGPQEDAAETETGAGTSASGPEEADSARAEVPFDELFRSFSLTDLDGEPVTQDIFRDSDLTLVNIWATFCNPCLQEMPDLGKLNREYQDAGKHFQVVGLVMDAVSVSPDGKKFDKDEDMIAKAKELVAQTGADYTHIVPEGDFAYSLVMSGEAQSVPTSVFVDSEGNIVGRTVIGSRSADNWKAIIDERLAGVSASEG